MYFVYWPVAIFVVVAAISVDVVVVVVDATVASV